jgi:hypothetical protein
VSLTDDAAAKGGRFCVGCAHYIYPPEHKHPDKCPVGQMEDRDRRIAALEGKVRKLEGRLSQLLAEHGQTYP